MYNELVNKNPHILIYPITHDSFRQYGRIVEEYDFSPWIQTMAQIPVPAEGNVYTADEQLLSGTDLAQQIRQGLYADMPIQVGYCNGNSSNLNALEYHKTQELNVAITDLVLLLADIRDIQNNTLSVNTVKAYYLPAGTACEIYGTTLHFAPCKVSDTGYKCIVVLPEGTNTPITLNNQAASGEEKLLWMQGKWLIAHKDSIPASKGAHVGIVGENIRIQY